MKTYLILLRFTDQGARNIEQSPLRARAFRQAAEQAGVKVLHQGWTTGKYDGVLLLQADNETKVLHCVADLSASGNVRPCSLRTFDADEFAAIVGA